MVISIVVNKDKGLVVIADVMRENPEDVCYFKFNSEINQVDEVLKQLVRLLIRDEKNNIHFDLIENNELRIRVSA